MDSTDDSRTVSCADILAIAYRDSAVEVGLVPEYQVELGRRDGTTANRKDADKFLPGPQMNYSELTQNFAAVSLDETDLVALSGAHTIGTTTEPCILVSHSIENPLRLKSEPLGPTPPEPRRITDSRIIVSGRIGIFCRSGLLVASSLCLLREK